MTLAVALNRAVHRLGAVSPSAQLDAEVLLAHVLNKDRAYLKAWPEFSLDDEHMGTYDQLLSARAQGTPIAYLIGTREFWSREFLVSPDVLIPRPETELLVQLTLDAVADAPGSTVLDLGTGSGAIAITIAAEYPAATVYASDLSEAALRVARLNAERYQTGNLHFLRSNWFADFPQGLRFDVIVSNPPYIPDSDPHLTQGDVRFEPPVAIRAGADGFDAFRTIVAQAGRRLNTGAWILMEHGHDQADRLHELLEPRGYTMISHHADLQGHMRVTRAAWWRQSDNA